LDSIQRSQRSEFFVIENSLLRVLGGEIWKRGKRANAKLIPWSFKELRWRGAMIRIALALAVSVLATGHPAPVEQPMKFEFVINLKTAKQIGVTIPQWTLMKADKVIK